MRLSLQEFQFLSSELKKPVEVKIDRQFSITIAVKAEDGALVNPIKIDSKTIRTLGIYEIAGIKYWIVRE
jgi:ribosomal protein S12